LISKPKIAVCAFIYVLIAACGAAIAVDISPTVQLHGYLQNRLYVPQGVTPEFREERVAVSATAALPKDSIVYVELDYHPSLANNSILVESAYYDTPFGPGHIRVGKGRDYTFGMTPYYANRKTSNYGIVAEKFTQDRIQGVQYLLQKGKLDIGASVHTQLRLGNRAIGTVPGDVTHDATHTVSHLAFRDTPGDLSQRLAFSARVGGIWKDIKAGVSGSISSLDSRDLANLTTSSATNTLTPNGTPSLLPADTTSTTFNKYGIDFIYKKQSGWLLQGEAYKSNISTMSVNAWDVLAGWDPPKGWKFYARYSQQNTDAVRTANPLSWDVQQITLSVVQPIRKGIWMQYEYEINTEDSNTGADVKNNIGFAELFVSF
jgi:hypothetical protein